MLQSIIVTNPKGESLTLTLSRPELSGIYIESIDGLGPATGSISNSDYATRDGAMYISSRLEPRSMIFKLGMLDTPSVEENRLKIYKYFQVKKPVTIRVITDQHDVITEGYVETNEVDIFTDRETCSIGVLCLDPYFYDVAVTREVFGESIPKFEFEFSNESTTEALLEMSERRIDTQSLIEYPGDGDTGITMSVQMLADVSVIELYHASENETMTLRAENMPATYGDVFRGKDIIEICTIKGKKKVELVRNGARYNIVTALDKRPDWFQITPGLNIFAYRIDDGDNDSNVVIEISFNVAYEGV